MVLVRRPHSFVTVRYLLNQWMDFDQTCIDTLLSFYEQLKFPAQLSWAWKMFYNLGSWSYSWLQVDEAKAELQEIVEYLKDPEKFRSLGAKLPKGMISCLNFILFVQYMTHKATQNMMDYNTTTLQMGFRMTYSNLYPKARRLLICEMMEIFMTLGHQASRSNVTL